VPVVLINAREGHGLDKLKKIAGRASFRFVAKIFPIASEICPAVDSFGRFKLSSDYAAYLIFNKLIL